MRIILMGAIPALLLCGTPAMAAEFHAQVAYTEQGQPQTMQLYVKGSQYRIERTADGQRAIVLVDKQAKKIYLLDPAAKQYHQSDTDNMLVAMYDPFELPDVEAGMSEGITKNLGTEVINGDLTDKYEVRTKDGSTALVDYWVSRKLQFPVKIVVPMQGGATANVVNVQEAPQPQSLFAIPAGYAFVPEPGQTPPPWASAIASAPLVSMPFSRMMSSGQIVRLRVSGGETIQVIGSQSAAKTTQITAVPYNGGKIAGDVSTGTYNFGPGEKWTVTVGPAPAGGGEIVVRVNKGRALVSIRRK